MGVHIYRVRTVLSGWQGGPGMHTAYFRVGASPGTSEALTVANRVRGSWDVFKTSLANVTTALTLPAVDELDSETGDLMAGYSVTAPAVVTGTDATVIGPPTVMGVLQLFTGTVVDGHRLKGKMFLGPLSQTNTHQAAPASGLATNIQAFGTAISGGAGVNPLVVWHRPVYKGKPPVLDRIGSVADVSSTQAAPYFGTLRSRRD